MSAAMCFRPASTRSTAPSEPERCRGCSQHHHRRAGRTAVGGAARLQRPRSWHPIVAKSTIERGYPSDKIGCVRRFTMQDGAELREQLLALSDLEMTFSYCLLDTPIPLFNYVAHVRLLPVTDGNRSFWHWEGRFTTPAGPRDGDRRARRQRNLFKRVRGGPPVPELCSIRKRHARQRDASCRDYRKPLAFSPATAARTFSAAARC